MLDVETVLCMGSRQDFAAPFYTHRPHRDYEVRDAHGRLVMVLDYEHEALDAVEILNARKSA